MTIPRRILPPIKINSVFDRLSVLCNLTIVFDLMFFYCKNKASAKVGSSQRVGAPPACMRYKKRTNLEIELFLYLEKG